MIKPLNPKQRKKAVSQEPLFVKRARRAMLRAARNVAAENKRLGLPLIVSKG
ncbi:MAG: hypothetical protein PHD76_01765 [Methylacidiphilales bacterium]|nr:hypothetical protein [Candidatus Methylacidiphilales bacterium]